MKYHLELFKSAAWISGSGKPACQFTRPGTEEHITLSRSEFQARRKTDSRLCCRQCKKIDAEREASK